MARKKKLPSGMWDRNGVYYARFTVNGCRVREKLSTDLRVACEMLADLKLKFYRRSKGEITNDYEWDKLVDEFMMWARQQTRMEGDYRTNLRLISDFRPVKMISQLDHQLVFGFRQWRLDQGTAPATINKNVATLNSMLNKGVEWRRIGSNPIAGLKRLPEDEKMKDRRSLTLEEVDALFDNSPEHLRRVWRMFMVTGIRRDELVDMLFDDVDFERREVTVRSRTAKNHKPRTIPLDDEALEVVADLKAKAPDRQPVKGTTPAMTAQQAANFSRDHVFVSRANTPMRNNLLGKFYACCRKAGIEGAKPGGSVDIHSLRVSYCTLAIEHGADPKNVQEVLGHATLAMTMNTYAKSTDRGKRQAISALPFANASGPADVISIEEGRKMVG